MEKAKTGKTSLQKRSRKITAVAVVVSMILLAGGSLIHVLLQDILESAGELEERVPYEDLVTTEFAAIAAQ